MPTGIVVKSQATRSRSQNRKIARQNLAEKIEAIEKGPESRIMLKTEIKSRKKASKSKKAKRKYRALAEDRGLEEADESVITIEEPRDRITEEECVQETYERPIKPEDQGISKGLEEDQ